MTGYSFRPAIREKVGLLIGLAGPSGSGKTYSAMRLAAGIVGPGKRFAVIDTEARRSLHYADNFAFDICDLHPPFRPSVYADAIQAADDAGYGVIVVDSMSHEWSSDGGVLDWQEEELQRMAGDNYAKREACKMASWIKPKGDHKKMISRLLQVKATVILCFRAEEKLKMEKVKDEHGKEKTAIIPVGWQPICEKNLPYELTVSFLLTPDAPGMPKPLKLQEQHKALFPLDKPINEESGKLVAQWAEGGSAASVFITNKQREELIAAMGNEVKPADLLKRFNAKASKELLSDKFDDMMEWIKAQLPQHVIACPECGMHYENGACRNEKCPEGRPV